MHLSIKMNIVIEYTLVILRKIYIKITGANHQLFKDVQLIGDPAGQLIYHKLQGDEPVMICRFGSTELACLIRYLNKREHIPYYKKLIKYLFSKNMTYPFWWDKIGKNDMDVNSGFFPSTEANLERFCEEMLDDMEKIDVLGSWLSTEKDVEEHLPSAIQYVGLRDLEPYYHTQPWSRAFEGKKILVIHPFENTIKLQFANKDMLFENEHVLPDFELKTIKSVQTMSHNSSHFASWFEANDYMRAQIKNIDFDIAIIGCGAYGLSLAAFVKSIGKKAVHMGGATQLLFGIKGGRWDKWPFYQDLYNEHWVRVNPSDFPEKDGGEMYCYL